MRSLILFMLWQVQYMKWQITLGEDEIAINIGTGGAYWAGASVPTDYKQTL